MKYIKTYEYNSINYNDVYKFLKKIIKLHYKEYLVEINHLNIIYIYNNNEIFTEPILSISFQPNLLIFDIYNKNFELTDILIKYFNLIMEKIYEKDGTYSFKYNSNTKLKIKDFNLLLNTNKFNL
jgi:hypothetical protein